MTSLRSFLPALAVTLLLAAPARADAEADAKDLFSRGRELRAKGNCAEAAPMFRKAIAIYPAGLGSARNLAECEEELRHFASARRAWLDLKRALQSTQEAKYAGWDADARAAIDRLAPLVAKLTVDVVAPQGGKDAPVDPASIVVQLNGDTLPATLIGTELERDPGSYRVHAARTGESAGADETVTLAAGESKRVTLHVSAVEATREAAVLPARAATSSQHDPNAARRLTGWVALGLGGASLATSAVAFIVRNGALSDLERSCPNYGSAPCDPSLRPLVDRGHLAATLTSVFAAIGVVATSAGVALVLTSPPPQKSGFVVRPSIGQANGLVTEWVLP